MKLSKHLKLNSPTSSKKMILTKNQPFIKQFFTNQVMSNNRRDTKYEEPENLTPKSPNIKNTEISRVCIHTQIKKPKHWAQFNSLPEPRGRNNRRHRIPN